MSFCEVNFIKYNNEFPYHYKVKDKSYSWLAIRTVNVMLTLVSMGTAYKGWYPSPLFATLTFLSYGDGYPFVGGRTKKV